MSVAPGGATRNSGLALVWAQGRGGVIGLDGGLPWHLAEDLARFRALTSGHPVIMGRATWQSLPPRFRPLPGRENIVLSRDPHLAVEGATVLPGVEEAVAHVRGREAWVIGGGSVYAATIGRADRLEVTEVDEDVRGDTYAPAVDDSWEVVSRDPAEGWHTGAGGLRYRFVTYLRAR